MITPRPHRAGGFTLVELLVVIAIIGLVSAATLPSILTAINHRQTSDAASVLQAALVNARDSAVRAGAPSGLRFLIDPTLAPRYSEGVLGYSSFVATKTAPDYTEGHVSLLPNTPTNTGGTYFSPYTSTNTGLFIVYGPTNEKGSTTLPAAPTNWYWNVRRGEKIRINNAGPFYTIVGPATIPLGINNPEGFVNEGPPGTTPSVVFPSITTPNAEYLILADGRDGNVNGYIDEGFDGVDNDSNGYADDITVGTGLSAEEPFTPPSTYPANWVFPTYPYPTADPTPFECETESPAIDFPPYSHYTIARRPSVDARARITSLPSEVVIDASTLFTTQERSRLPIFRANPQYFDLLFAPNGQVLANNPYAGTAALPTVPFYHFWVTERDGVNAPSNITSTATYPTLPILPALKGERRLVTLNNRSGFLTVKMIEDFSPTDSNAPYRDAQNGARDKQ